MLQSISMNTVVMVGLGGESPLAGGDERKQPLPKPPSGTHQPIDTSVVIGSLANHSTGGRPAKK